MKRETPANPYTLTGCAVLVGFKLRLRRLGENPLHATLGPEPYTEEENGHFRRHLRYLP